MNNVAFRQRQVHRRWLRRSSPSLAYFAPCGGHRSSRRSPRATKLPVHVGTYGIDRAFRGPTPASCRTPSTRRCSPIQPGPLLGGVDGLTDDEATRVPAGPLERRACRRSRRCCASRPRTRLVWGNGARQSAFATRSGARRSRPWAVRRDRLAGRDRSRVAGRDPRRARRPRARGGRGLGDTPQKGIVWVARNAFPGRIRADRCGAWPLLGRRCSGATNRLAGEEYPDFSGDPRASAREFDSGPPSAARRRGRSARTLGRRYVAGLTPGIELRKGLGGNVKRRVSQAALRKWRARLRRPRRAADGVARLRVFRLPRAQTGPRRRRSCVRSRGRASARPPAGRRC